MKSYLLEEVFGVSNKIIETYIYRDEIDSRFLKALDSDRHVVIYGSSKQGKTSLYKRHLAPNEYILIECSPTTQIIDINKSILRQAGVSSSVSTTITTEENNNISAGLNVKLKVPAIGEMGAKVGAGESSKLTKSKNFSTYEYNLSLAQDVSEALKILEFKKKIIIENFHYLTDSTQRKLAFDLRTFHDLGIQFIILGIWKEKNRLFQFNGDLLDRITDIPVEPWHGEEFHKIMTKGEEMLNVDFSLIRDAIVNDSFQSVGVMQELCKETCIAAGIFRTESHKKLLEDIHYSNATSVKVEHYSGRHFRSFEAFIEQKNNRKNGNKTLYIPYYFLKVLSMMDFVEIHQGLKRMTIHEKIKEIHHCPDNVRSSDLSHFLHNIVRYQISKGIRPPLFDYDISNRTLRIIDSTLFFYLRYFFDQNVIDYLSNPMETE